MGLVSFSLPQLFEAAFGYKTNAFEFPQIEGTEGQLKDGDGVYANRLPKYTSQGAAYYSTDDQGRDYYMPVLLGGYELSHPVVSVIGRKNIVETPLVGRRGTVKELINTDDYVISIKGLIISEGDYYPEAKVKEMRQLFEQSTALEIVSPITDIFLLTPDRKGYDKVVIKSMSFPPIVGVMNVRSYEIELVSDESFTLIEIDE